MVKPNLDHPSLAHLKAKFPSAGLFATEFRGQTTVVVPKQHLLEVMAFLHSDENCQYDFLSDVTAVDYLNYPAKQSGPTGRFGVIYNIVSRPLGQRLFVKVLLDPSLATDGIEDDPALHVDSVTSIWPGAEWRERETFDMFGIHFDQHPDLRRILTWEKYPAHPLRKDYPLRGRGERETYKVIGREDA